MSCFRLIFPVVLVIGLTGCLRPNAELNLTLSKSRWELGESLWYRLEVKNAGWKSIEFEDPFWFHQGRLPDNSRYRHGTFLVVSDSSGRELTPTSLAYGVHGEFDLWANDCGDGVACAEQDNGPIKLKRGQSKVATPSIEAPLRPRRRGAGLADVRACDGAVASPADCARLKGIADGMWKFGDPRRVVDAVVAARDQPPGYRILDTLQFPGPGRYRVKAVLNAREEVPPLSADEEIAAPGWCLGGKAEVCAIMAKALRADWGKKTPEAVYEIRRHREEAEKRNERRLYVESKTIEFEVVEPKRPGLNLGAEAGKEMSESSVGMEAARKALEKMWAPK